MKNKKAFKMHVNFGNGKTYSEDVVETWYERGKPVKKYPKNIKEAQEMAHSIVKSFNDIEIARYGVNATTRTVLNVFEVIGEQDRAQINHGFEIILHQVQRECNKQLDKFGIQNHPCLDPVLLNRKGGCTPERMCEEYEIPSETRAKFLCQNSEHVGDCTYAHIFIEEVSEAISEINDPVKRRRELIQCAAVLVSWINKIDRIDIKKKKS